MRGSNHPIGLLQCVKYSGTGRSDPMRCRPIPHVGGAGALPITRRSPKGVAHISASMPASGPGMILCNRRDARSRAGCPRCARASAWNRARLFQIFPIESYGRINDAPQLSRLNDIGNIKLAATPEPERFAAMHGSRGRMTTFTDTGWAVRQRRRPLGQKPL